MNETLKTINSFLKKFNNTFELATGEIVEDEEDNVTNELKIVGLKNDGSEFVIELSNLFGTIIQSTSSEYELIYTEEKGLVIGRKVIDYVFDEDE